ncbi:hypothetical protein [Carboxylicivirga sp. RSCT41]|uniref:hypothetical protein n=1 Tax=Carboxylicivirga agarovorans TaxID=3417570 RepID=UPI003D357529
MRTIFIAVLWVFTLVWTHSQEKLSLNFNSSFEEAAFTNLSDSANVDYLHLLMAITPRSDELTQVNAQLQIDNFIKTLDPKKLQHPKHDKVIKYLFKSVHNNFFRRYDEKAFFSDIFIAGLYNCVSASALYALIFNELNIPYEIKELPTHVYLVVYPDAERIKVETTDPLRGYLNPDTRFKREYVEFLKDNKLISDFEYRSSTVDKLFGAHYYNATSVELEVLAAFQYYNEGIFLLQNSNNERALEYFKKSYQIHPDPRTKYFSVLLMEEYLALHKFNDIDDVEVFIDLYKVLPEKYNKHNVANDFKYFSGKYLFEENDVNAYDEVYTLFSTNLKDTVVTNEISFWYHLYKGEAFAVKRKMDKAFRQFCLAHKYNPGSLYLQEDLNNCAKARVFSNVSFVPQSIELRLNELDYLRKEFTFLNTHPEFVSSYLLMCGNLVNAYLGNNQLSKAVEFMGGVESEFDLKEYHDIKRQWALHYRAVAVYYEFSRRNKRMAEKYYVKANKLDPTNMEIRQDLRRFGFI